MDNLSAGTNSSLSLEKGRTYQPTVQRRYRRRGEMHVTVRFKSDGKGKWAAGTFTLTRDDAERLAHALLLANSAGDVNPIEFPIGEQAMIARMERMMN